jgi:hypothetical protein
VATHLDVWRELVRILGRSDFLYVALSWTFALSGHGCARLRFGDPSSVIGAKRIVSYDDAL